MNADVVIDRFRWPDISNAAEIEAQSFPIGAWKAESFWNELASGPDRSVYLAARVDGKLIGYIGVMVDDEDAHLHTLTVDAAYRGRGVAKQLLVAVLELLVIKTCTRWLLEVSEHNGSAIGLYRGFGFADLAVRTDYYGPGDSAIVMALGLATDSGRDFRGS